MEAKFLSNSFNQGRVAEADRADLDPDQALDRMPDRGQHARAALGAIERLRGMPSISELRSAVIWTKGVSSYVPDYHVELLPTSPWIHQPFEEYDGMRPDVLAKKFAI